jgi:PAS domain S-box-containing protein
MVTPFADERSQKELLRWVGRYALAVALVTLATLLTRQTQPAVQEISPLYFAAIAISTWFGGLGPALAATALSGWASAYFFYDIPAGTGAFGWDDALRLGVFLMVALLMSALMHLRQRAEDSLQRANDQLENRVRERTAELETSMRRVVESEERFRILMEGVADYAICMLDVRGNVISWNSGSERIHGYGQSEIFGKHFGVFYTPADQQRGKPAAHIERATAENRYEDEGWRTRKDGPDFWANVIITPLRDERDVLRGFAHITRDITEFKRLQNEVLKISESEQQRIGQDLHDGLGQDLTGLAFLTQNLGRRLAGNARPEDAEEAQRISRLVIRAIEQTRELARGLSPVELGADGLLAALRGLAEQVQKTCGIPLELNLDTTVRVEDHAAAVHLYRISQEAITNAARHSGGSYIRLGLQDVDRDIVLTVEDDGKGIPADAAGNAAGNVAGRGGLGLRLMLYRARMIGATLTLAGGGQAGGTVVRCVYRNALDSRQRGNGAIDTHDRNPVGGDEASPLQNSARG